MRHVPDSAAGGRCRSGPHGIAGRRFYRGDRPGNCGIAASRRSAVWPTSRRSRSPRRPTAFVLLDAAGRPLTPIILWPDRRAADLEAEVRRRCDVPGFSATTGVPQVSFQFMAAKLLWLQRQSPETWKRTDKLCLISDYLTLLAHRQARHRGGRGGADGLGRHSSLPVVARDARSLRDRPSAGLPSIVRAGTDLGPIDPAAAQRFGLPDVVPFRRRLSRSIRRGHRGGQHRAGNALGNDRHRAGDGSLRRSVRRSAWSRRLSGAGVSRRALLADGLRRRFGQLSSMVSRSTARSA